MTRKDFEMIARQIKYLPHHSSVTDDQRDEIARNIANALEVHSGNANFDKARFLKACGFHA